MSDLAMATAYAMAVGRTAAATVIPVDPLINFRTSSPRVRGDVINLPIVSNTALSPYMPFACGFSAKALENSGHKKVLMYNMVGASAATLDHSPLSRYEQVVDALISKGKPEIFKSENKMYHAYKGCLYEVDEVLGTQFHITLALESNYSTVMDKNSLDFSKFVLLVSNSFALEGSTIYKRLNTDYIRLFQSRGIDVIFTSSIMKKCFVPIPAPKFDTLDEMKAHLEFVNKAVVYEAV